MVDALKIMSDVCFEGIACFCVVLRGLSFEFLKPFYGAMGSFSLSIGERIVDESFFYDRLDDIAERMMDYAVAEIGFADLAGLWVADDEGL